MRPLIQRPSPSSRRHSLPLCPFHARGGRRVLVNASSPVTQTTDPGSRATSSGQPQVQQVLVQGHALHSAPAHGSTAVVNGGAVGSGASRTAGQPLSGGAFVVDPHRDRAIKLMQEIKAARSWQQLEAIVDDNARALNYMHVSAVVTHMAQLHASSSGSSSAGDYGGLVLPVNGGAAAGPDHHARGSSTAQPALAFPSTGEPQGMEGYDNAELVLSGPVEGLDSPYGWLLQPHLAQPSAQQHPAHSSGRLISTGGQGSRARVGYPPPAAAASPLGAESHLHEQHAHQQTASHQQQHQQQLLRPGTGRTLFLQRLERAVMAHLPEYGGRQLANTLWAMAKLGHRPHAAWLQAVLTRAHAKLGEFEPQHLANTLYALMLLQYMPPKAWLRDVFEAVQQQVLGFRPAEVAQLCYAVGKMRLQPPRKMVDALLVHAVANITHYGIRELSLLLYGVVFIQGGVPRAWLRECRIRVMTLVVKSGALGPRELSALASCLNPRGPMASAVRAQLSTMRPAVAEAVASQEGGQRRRGPALADAEGREQRLLSPNGWQQATAPAPQSAGSGGENPGSVALQPQARSGSEVNEFCRAKVADQARFLPAILLSMANLNHQPPPAFMAVVLRAVQRGAESLDGPQLSTVMLALAFLHYEPEPTWFRLIWRRIMESLDTLDSQQHANLLWAVAKLRVPIPPADQKRLLSRAAADLPDCSSAQLVMHLQAASRLEPRPHMDWVELLESHIYHHLPRLTPLELADVISHMATLGHRPHRSWMALWVETTLPRLSALGLGQLASVAAAAAELHFRPPACFYRLLMACATERMQAALADSSRGDFGYGQPWQHLDDDTAFVVCRERLRVAGRAARWEPGALSQLLWGMAVLEIMPKDSWMLDYMACLRLTLDHLTVTELSRTVWAIAQLGYDPGVEWTEEFQRRMRDLEEAEETDRLGPSNGSAVDRKRGFTRWPRTSLVEAAATADGRRAVRRPREVEAGGDAGGLSDQDEALGRRLPARSLGIGAKLRGRERELVAGQA